MSADRPSPWRPPAADGDEEIESGQADPVSGPAGSRPVAGSVPPCDAGSAVSAAAGGATVHDERDEYEPL